MKFVRRKFTTAVITAAALSMTVQTVHAYNLDKMHQFAIKTLNQIQKQSIKEGREYCGLIGYDKSGTFVATKPKRGGATSCRIVYGSHDFTVVASYHTHGSFNHMIDTEAPSIQDLEHDFVQDMNGYIGTPGGRVWFNNQDKQMSVMLCGTGCILTDANYHHCDKTEPKTAYTMKGLKHRAKHVNEPCSF